MNGEQEFYTEKFPAVDPNTGQPVIVTYKIAKGLKNETHLEEMGDKNMGFTPEQEEKMDAPQQ